jgi:hypothetical protein
MFVAWLRSWVNCFSGSMPSDSLILWGFYGGLLSLWHLLQKKKILAILLCGNLKREIFYSAGTWLDYVIPADEGFITSMA